MRHFAPVAPQVLIIHPSPRDPFLPFEIINNGTWLATRWLKWSRDSDDSSPTKGRRESGIKIAIDFVRIHFGNSYFFPSPWEKERSGKVFVITRRNQSLVKLCLFLSYNFPGDPPIRLLFRIGPKNIFEMSSLGHGRFNPSNENRLWTGFVAIPIQSCRGRATFRRERFRGTKSIAWNLKGRIVSIRLA